MYKEEVPQPQLMLEPKSGVEVKRHETFGLLIPHGMEAAFKSLSESHLRDAVAKARRFQVVVTLTQVIARDNRTEVVYVVILNSQRYPLGPTRHEDVTGRLETNV